MSQISADNVGLGCKRVMKGSILDSDGHFASKADQVRRYVFMNYITFPNREPTAILCITPGCGPDVCGPDGGPGKNIQSVLINL